MGTFIEMTGKRFGRLTVSGKGGYNKHHQMYWVCNCDCGATKEVLGHLLRNGMTQSCDELGLKIGTVWARINKYGYSVDRALTVGWRARNAY